LSTEFSRGTPSYRAPELIAEVSTFSNKVDIWGLGCILFELAVKRKAFTDDWAVRDYAERKQKLVVLLQYFVNERQTPLTNLIHEMLQVNPRLRPTAQQLHAVFTNLLKPAPLTPTHESESPLFSKIYRPLSDNLGSNKEHNVM
jgi:serine/threonine protein kinase